MHPASRNRLNNIQTEFLLLSAIEQEKMLEKIRAERAIVRKRIKRGDLAKFQQKVQTLSETELAELMQILQSEEEK